MFDNLMIVEGSLRDAGEGAAVDLRIPYYRGLGLSMVDVDLVIDGTEVPREDLTFTVHGTSYPVTGLGEAVDDRWGFHEAATVTARGTRLAPGSHTVAATVSLRVSYLPFPSVTRFEREQTVA